MLPLLLAAGGLLLFLAFRGLGLLTWSVTRSIAGAFSANPAADALADAAQVTANPTVPAAQPGTLTTHTTNTTGSLTMTNSNHGIVTGQRLDIYWAGGQCYGAVAGTVSGNVVPIASVSGGSALPASSTPVTVGIPTSEAFNVVGNNLTGLAAWGGVSGPACYFVFNNGSTDQLAVYVAPGGLYEWDNQQGSASPLAGDTPTVVWVSHNSTAGPATTLAASALTH